MALQRNVYISDKIQHKRRRRKIFLSIGMSIGIIAMVSTVILVARMDSLQIKTFQIEGAHSGLEAEIRSEVNKHLSENLLLIFPRSNRFLFQRAEMETRLGQLFPKIKTVSVKRVGVADLLISVEERKIAGLWCSGEASLFADADSSVGDCYALDETGYIYETSPYFSDHSYFEYFGQPLITQNEATTTETRIVYDTPFVGVQYLPENMFVLVNTFVGMLKEEDIIVHTLVIHDREFFELVLKDGGVIRFSPSQDLRKATDDIKTSLTKKFTDEPAKKLGDVDYIDVRFANKVVFKFKGATSD